MFQGMIDHLGYVQHVSTYEHSMTLSIRCLGFQEPWVLGESIAIDGVCLTICHIHGDIITFDISPTTWACSHFSSVKVGQRVHVERSYRTIDRIGGHLIKGHIDECVVLLSIEKPDERYRLWTLSLPSKPACITSKGSVALDGVSLTVHQCHSYGFEVMLIPHTLACTHLIDASVGQKIHIEYDDIARYVIRYLELQS